MTEPHHRTDTGTATRRAASLGRSGLVVLAVLAAFLTPVRSTTTPTRVAPGRTLRTIGAHAPVPAHAAPTGPVARVARVRLESHHRAGTPFGTVPGGIVVAAVLLLSVAVASRARPSARRPHPSFLRRGPPLLFAAG